MRDIRKWRERLFSFLYYGLIVTFTVFATFFFIFKMYSSVPLLEIFCILLIVTIISGYGCFPNSTNYNRLVRGYSLLTPHTYIIRYKKKIK